MDETIALDNFFWCDDLVNNLISFLLDANPASINMEGISGAFNTANPAYL